MGGVPSSIVAEHLTDSMDAHTLSNQVHKLRTFNASIARCHSAADRHHLLAVIETSFGQTAPFNILVRQIFQQVEPLIHAVPVPVLSVAESDYI